jgi:hypothetical protein
MYVLKIGWIKTQYKLTSKNVSKFIPPISAGARLRKPLKAVEYAAVFRANGRWRAIRVRDHGAEE